MALFQPQGVGDSCPTCGAAGYATNRIVGAPNSYPVMGAALSARDALIQWSCACGTDWETIEDYGQPATRRILSVAARQYAHGGLVASSSGPWTFHWGLGSPSHLPDPYPPRSEPEPERTIHGSVIGYRAWRIRNWQLYGTGVNRAWAPGVNEATCDAGSGSLTYLAPNSHPAPSLGCDCGITALARFAEHDTHWSQADVHGAIEAWSDETDDAPHGRFILHGTGFRAQYGKIVLLAIEDDWPAAKKAAVRALAAEHEADVCKRSHLQDAAKEHGQLVPDDMLDWAREGEERGIEAIGAAALAQMQQAIRAGSVSVASLSQALHSLYAITPPKPARRKRHGPKPPAGLSQTLGYPGPPQGRLTAYRKGQRVRDRAGDVWRCAKGGKPGVWEADTA